MKGLKVTILSVLASTFLMPQAFAERGTIVGLAGASTVFVWKDKKAHDEALSVIKTNAHRTNPALLLPFVACIAQSGTEAVITSKGFMTHDVIVTAGPHAGCRGNVPREAFFPIITNSPL